MAFGISSMTSFAILEVCPGYKGFFMQPFMIPSKIKKPLHYEPEAANPVHNSYKDQNDHHKADQRSYSYRTVASLAQHHVSILPHSIDNET